MKKFFGIGLLALLTTAYFTSSCSRDEFSGSMIDAKKEAFNDNFKSEYGEIDPNHDWGFGIYNGTRAFTRSGNMTGKTPVAETSTGINANANEWADPDKHYGGWIVPAELTADQRELVTRYFQTVNTMTYHDPQFCNFFVQQVHKGTDATAYNTTEGIVASNGTPYTSTNMNHLTVGYNNQHINNFNSGSYGGNAEDYTEAGVVNTDGSVNVLDNGQHVGGSTHPDQIMLMVNIDDTGCMGYHCSATGESGTNAQRNDKAALVSWRTIAQWQVDNQEISSIEESCLNDTWNRSFVGFDLALKPFDECVVKDNNGNIQYAKLENISACPEYVWDGTTVMKIGTKPATKANQDITDMLANAAADGGGSITKNTSTGYWEWKGGNFVVSGMNVDLTGYTKLVIEYAEGTKQNYGLEISVDGYLTNWDQNRPGGETKVEVDITNATKLNSLKFMNGVSAKISKIYLSAGASDPYYESPYVIVEDANGNDMQIPLLSRNTNQYAGESITLSDTDLKITPEGSSVECLNLAYIQQLVSDGYYPTSPDLKAWSTFEDGDGYYSDWIVTLTEANRNEDTTTEEIVLLQSGRIFCEDLGTVDVSDIDYNDVVFDAWLYVKRKNNDPSTDVFYKCDIQLLAAGGTIPVQVAGVNVHQAFGVKDDVMVNTFKEGASNINSGAKHAEYGTDINKMPDKIVISNSTLLTDFYGNINIINIPIVVRTNNTAVELTAVNSSQKTTAPLKFMGPVGTPWAAERVKFGDAYPDFTNWVQNKDLTPWDNVNSAKACYFSVDSEME